ncbi:hypothetical protein HBZS_109710 [Helicobacter bizzozeronii CCUG 35545]|nr:hypothetical protein HBZS_109710 [Helicobacter bizzozeronii CCUG 35545]
MLYCAYKACKRSQGVVKDPKVGSVLCCDLLGNIAEHSGIYVGKDKWGEHQIVELLSTGEVRKSSPRQFIEGYNTATEIYVFARHEKTGAKNAKGEGYVKAVGSSSVANNALELEGKKFKYALKPNSEEYNCHKLVCHCLLGEKDDASYLLKNVKEAIYRRYKLSDDKTGFYEWDIKLF